MRIKQIEFLVTPADLAEFVREYPLPDRIVRLDLGTEEGRLWADLDYRMGRVRVPVQLALRVAELHPSSVNLAAEARVGMALPGPILHEILHYLVRQSGLSGIQVRGRHLRVSVVELMDQVPATFALQDLRFTPEGIRLVLADVTLAGAGAISGEAPEVEVVPPLPSPVPDPPPQYGDIYSRMRQKVEEWARRRVPPRYQFLIPWLLLLPDLFALIVRLMADPRVSTRAKVWLAATVAYVVSPVDLIPDFVPVAGLSDDLALVFLALADLLDETPEEVLQEHWSGQGEVVRVIRDGLRMIRQVLNTEVLSRLRNVLKRP